MKFSVIIPIYNTEKTLEAAIDSVLNQTYSDWELILVDDCSTDGSFEKEVRFTEQDARIKSIRLLCNSGNAKLPRDEGVKQAKGNYCVFLDSDDEIMPDYLQIMADSVRKNNTDIVLPIMVIMDSERQVEIGRVSKPQTVSDDVIDGKSACRLTLPEWKVGCGGMAFNKDLYKYVVDQNPYNYAFSDEFSERLMLYHAKTVAFSNAEYIYWRQDTSITHRKSTKLYEILCVDKQLVDFASTHYDDDVTGEVLRSMLCHLMVLQKDYYRDGSLYSAEEKKRIQRILQQAFDNIKRMDKNHLSFKERLLLFNPASFRLFCYFRK